MKTKIQILSSIRTKLLHEWYKEVKKESNKSINVVLACRNSISDVNKLRDCEKDNM